MDQLKLDLIKKHIDDFMKDNRGFSWRNYEDIDALMVSFRETGLLPFEVESHMGIDPMGEVYLEACYFELRIKKTIILYTDDFRYSDEKDFINTLKIAFDEYKKVTEKLSKLN